MAGAADHLHARIAQLRSCAAHRVDAVRIELGHRHVPEFRHPALQVFSLARLGNEGPEEVIHLVQYCRVRVAQIDVDN